MRHFLAALLLLAAGCRAQVEMASRPLQNDQREPAPPIRRLQPFPRALADAVAVETYWDSSRLVDLHGRYQSKIRVAVTNGTAWTLSSVILDVGGEALEVPFMFHVEPFGTAIQAVELEGRPGGDIHVRNLYGFPPG